MLKNPHCEDSCCCLRYNLEHDIFCVLLILEKNLGESYMMKDFQPMMSVAG